MLAEVVAVALMLVPAPSLSVRGQTLAWTPVAETSTYRLRTLGQGTVSVQGTQYTPLPQPGKTVSYRVRARGTAWSNTVTISWPSEGGEAEPPAERSDTTAGAVKYRLDAASYFDPFSGDVAWLVAHASRLLAYPTFGDRYVGVVPTLAYADAATEGYAPLSPSSIGSYVQNVKRDARVGYAGAFVDDVNWTVPFRDWSQSRSLEPEKHEMANLIEAVRAARPTRLIEMNSQFWDIWPLLKAHDPDVERALSKVNVVTKEFGVGPGSGITTAQGFREYFEYIDTLHAKGIHSTLAEGAGSNTTGWLEFNEATYFLGNDGGDFIDGHQQTPESWWPGFGVNLGAATEPRERDRAGLWKRRFSGGIVYAMEPGGSTKTIALPKTMRSTEWGTVQSVTLSPEQGAVLVG
jgi:hypothetical protein